MRRIRTTVRVLIAATAATGVAALVAPSAQAAIPVACSENALVDAVNLANSTPAKDTLTLASGCTYTMSTSHGSLADGPDALPVITTPIDMIGPATITRGFGTFRIAEVSPTGALTLITGVALTHGSAVGDGGAILNRGAVTLTNSSLSGNTATGNGGGLANADTPSGTAPAATFTRSPISDNSAGLSGGGVYNGQRGSLTTSGVSGSPMAITGNTAALNGGGIAAVDSTTSTFTQTAVSTNHADQTAGGVYRSNGTMTSTSSPISANTANNCLGSTPAVPTCTG
jgi:predicted outer membrane repeat protein